MIFSNIKIGTRLSISFGIFFIFMIVISLIAIGYMKSLAELTDKLYTHPYAVSTAILRIDANITRMHRSMKDIILVENTNDLNKAIAKIDAYEKEVLNDFRLVEERFLGDEEKVREGQKLFHDWKSIRDEVITLMKAKKKKEATALTNQNGAAHVAKLEESVQGFIKFAQNKAEGFNSAAFSSRNEALITTFVILAIFSIFTIVLGILITRSITFPLSEDVNLARAVAGGDLTVDISINREDELGVLAEALKNMVNRLREIIKELQNSSMQLLSSTNQISASATEQSRNIVQQNNAISNFSSGLNELSTTATEMGRSADYVFETSNQAVNLAGQGTEAIATLLSSIEEIRVTNEGTSEKFTNLVYKVEYIAKVMETINNIADKTNLLSVNASIEAVKAGEFGKGFSVVASEIRRLADQTVVATEEIKEFINDIQKAANDAMMSMEKSSATTLKGTTLVNDAGNSIQNLIEAVQETGPLLEEMRTAIKQQMENTQQMTENIKQIQQTANENKTSTDQTSEATLSLSEIAQKQMKTVQQFKLENRDLSSNI